MQFFYKYASRLIGNGCGKRWKGWSFITMPFVFVLFDRMTSGSRPTLVATGQCRLRGWTCRIYRSQLHNTAIEALANRLQASLNLSAGPLMRVAYIDLGPQHCPRLLWVVHHLAIDGVSWRILLEDFQTVLHQMRNGRPIQLPSKTTSFKQWAEKLLAHSREGNWEAEVPYWLNEQRKSIASLPLDSSATSINNVVASARSVKVTLSKEETRALLSDVPKAYQTQINDALLTALVQTLSRWTGSSRLLVDLESHGREDLFDSVDLSRTVGWFTAIYPVLFSLEAVNSPVEALIAIKEQLRRVPHNGIGHGVLRYLSGSSATAKLIRELPRAEVCFNYLGQLDAVLSTSTRLTLAEEPLGAFAVAVGGASTFWKSTAPCSAASCSSIGRIVKTYTATRPSKGSPRDLSRLLN